MNGVVQSVQSPRLSPGILALRHSFWLMLVAEAYTDAVILLFWVNVCPYEADTMKKTETSELFRNSFRAIFIYSLYSEKKCIKYIIQMTYLLFLFIIKPSLKKCFNRIPKKIDEDVVIDFKKALAKFIMNF